MTGKSRPRDAGAALARDFLSLANRDDDEDDVEIREFAVHFGDRLEINRRILADRRMGAATGFDAHDTLLRQGLEPRQHHRVFAGLDVVGDDGDREFVAHGLAQLLGQRVLPEPTGPPMPTRNGPLWDFMSGTASNVEFRVSWP